MKIVLGAPVAERAWVLPAWWECLERQTLQPDEYRFVCTPSQDGTEEMLTWPDLGPSLVRLTKLPYYSREQRNGDKKDPWRAKHLAALRNQLRTLVLASDADIFISLDTDILLKDKTTLEQLVETLCGPRLQDPAAEWGWDVVNGTTYLHPWGEKSLCYNAGFFTDRDHGSFTQSWRRADLNDVLVYKPPLRIDIPMAFFAIRRFALSSCKYRAHECGEDVGFAQSLQNHGFRVGWRNDLVGTHVWNSSYLEEALAA